MFIHEKEHKSFGVWMERCHQMAGVPLAIIHLLKVFSLVSKASALHRKLIKVQNLVTEKSLTHFLFLKSSSFWMKNSAYIKIRKEAEGLVWMIYRNFLLFFLFPLQKLLSPPQLPSVLQNGSISSFSLILFTTRKLQNTPDNSQDLWYLSILFCLIWHETRPSYYQGQIILPEGVSLIRIQFVTPQAIPRDWFSINLGLWPSTRHSLAALRDVFGWKTRVGLGEMSLPLEDVNDFSQPTPSRIPSTPNLDLKGIILSLSWIYALPDIPFFLFS